MSNDDTQSVAMKFIQDNLIYEIIGGSILTLLCIACFIYLCIRRFQRRAYQNQNRNNSIKVKPRMMVTTSSTLSDAENEDAPNYNWQRGVNKSLPEFMRISITTSSHQQQEMDVPRPRLSNHPRIPSNISVESMHSDIARAKAMADIFKISMDVNSHNISFDDSDHENVQKNEQEQKLNDKNNEYRDNGPNHKNAPWPYPEMKQNYVQKSIPLQYESEESHEDMYNEMAILDQMRGYKTTDDTAKPQKKSSGEPHKYESRSPTHNYKSEGGWNMRSRIKMIDLNGDEMKDDGNGDDIAPKMGHIEHNHKQTWDMVEIIRNKTPRPPERRKVNNDRNEETK